jgi:hypothetical protein
MEAYIIKAYRSAVGKAKKGSFKNKIMSEAEMFSKILELAAKPGIK